MASAMHCCRVRTIRFWKIDHHRFIRGHDHSFSWKIIESGLIERCITFFPLTHTGDHEVVEGKWNMVRALVSSGIR